MLTRNITRTRGHRAGARRTTTWPSVRRRRIAIASREGRRRGDRAGGAAEAEADAPPGCRGWAGPPRPCRLRRKAHSPTFCLGTCAAASQCAVWPGRVKSSYYDYDYDYAFVIPCDKPGANPNTTARARLCTTPCEQLLFARRSKRAPTHCPPPRHRVYQPRMAHPWMLMSAAGGANASQVLA